MAKILIVSRKLSETSWQLAKSLSDQQHEIIFLTGRNEKIPDQYSKIHLMTYFKTWSLYEGLQLLPHLFSLNPQIFHLLLENDEIDWSEILITFFIKFFPGTIIATSIFHIKKGFGVTNPIRYLVQESDIITCPSDESLHYLKGLDIRNKKQGRGILAPTLNSQITQSNQFSEIPQFKYLLKKNYILVPFFETSFDHRSDFYKRMALIMKTHFVLLNGNQKNWSYFERNKLNYWLEQQGFREQWGLTGLDPHYIPEVLIENAKALLLAGISFTSEELTRYYRQILKKNCPLILDSSQASIHAVLWKSRLNCWIVEKNKFNIEFESLLSKETFFLPSKISEQILLQKEASDIPINELNRLYSRALQSANR